MYRRLVPRVVPAACLVSVSIVVAFGVVHAWGTACGPMQDVARVCAVLALTWSVFAAAAKRMPANIRATGGAQTELVSQLLVVALLLGVVAAVVQSMVLTMRLASAAVDLTNGYPGTSTLRYGFGTAGLWSLLLLCAACVVSAASTGDRRLWTCQLWSAILLACWACLLTPEFRASPAGGFERTGNTLLLPVALSAALALAVWSEKRIGRCRVPRIDPGPPDSGCLSGAASSGLTVSATIIAAAVALLGCYHLAVPVAAIPGGFRAGALIIMGSLATTAVACFLLLRRGWSDSLCDTAMGLTSLGFGALATAAVPAEPASLAERYPMMFNAMIIGLAFATGMWAHLAFDWQPQSNGASAEGIRVSAPRARRFAFLSAALALVLGAAMAVWPRWPGIAAMDDSLGRVAAGSAGNLFLLLVLLWSSRRVHRLTFQILTVLSVISAAGFLTIRMLPFTPQFG